MIKMLALTLLFIDDAVKRIFIFCYIHLALKLTQKMDSINGSNNLNEMAAFK